MSVTTCLGTTDTIHYVNGGGHFWAFLNWAMGLRANGCRVIWLAPVNPTIPETKIRPRAQILKDRLKHYGFENCLAICSQSSQPLSWNPSDEFLNLDAAAEADMLLNQHYDLPAQVVSRFRRTALLDIDPGLLQLWMVGGNIQVAPHDLYFTIGETVGQRGTRIPSAGMKWIHTAPCVSLDAWTTERAPDDVPFTTVSHWSGDEYMEDNGEVYANDKRAGFMPFAGLPRHTTQRLELALCLAHEDDPDVEMLRRHGWSVRDSYKVAASPQAYQEYIQQSRGEFSCVKPSCVRLQNAWMSDRSLCYLASAKPVIVQDTGPSRLLPDAEGLFRFRRLSDAVGCLEKVAANYEFHCKAARALAKEHFDARKVVGKLLGTVLN